MPLYVYQAIDEGCSRCSDGWEELQSASEEPVKHCPSCGSPVKKVPASFSSGRGDVLSDASLKEHGFKKLRKTEDGLQREV
ncbi:MAG: FmdB family zinc ribbon protein [Planctomycetota bacterium]